jgi:hypothetical protein
MGNEIWRQHGFKPLHYRLLWWLIDMGAAQGLLGRGWMQIASEDLGVHRITLNRALKKLHEKRMVVAGKKGSWGILPQAFDSEVDESRVKVLPSKGALR